MLESILVNFFCSVSKVLGLRLVGRQALLLWKIQAKDWWEIQSSTGSGQKYYWIIDRE
jgi:hypothetical protein